MAHYLVWLLTQFHRSSMVVHESYPCDYGLALKQVTDDNIAPHP